MEASANMIKTIIEQLNKVINEESKLYLEGTNKSFGARPLRRTIQNLVEDNLAEAILEGNTSKELKLTVEDEKVVVKG